MAQREVFGQQNNQDNFSERDRINGKRAHPVPAFNPSDGWSEKKKSCKGQTGKKIQNNNQIGIISYNPPVQKRKKEHQKKAYAQKNKLLFEVGKIPSSQGRTV